MTLTDYKQALLKYSKEMIEHCNNIINEGKNVEFFKGMLQAYKNLQYVVFYGLIEFDLETRD